MRKADAQSPVAQASGVRKADAQSPVAQASGVRKADAQSPVAQASGVRKADAQSPVAQASGVRKADAQDPVVKGSDAGQPAAQDPVVQSSGVGQPAAQDPVVQSPGVGKPAAQDPVPQGGRPAPGPEGVTQLTPVEEPFTASVARSDLPGRFTPPDPIEGVWRLRTRVVAGQPAMSGEGFMFIGRRHLMVQFVAPGTNPDIPLLRSGSYTWKRVDELDTVRLMGLFGYYNDGAGDTHIEPEGAMAVRRLQLIDGGLRMQQDAGNWLDFVRVE